MHDIFSIIIIIGIFGTFLPQYVRIFRKGSSVGLSPHFLLLGITSVLAQLINIIVMQIRVLDDCMDPEKSGCLSNVLGIVQVIVLTTCIATNCVLFLVYYPKPLGLTTEGNEALRCIKIFIGFLLFCTFVLLVTFAAFGKYSSKIRNVGQFFGIFCTILSCIQYIPQIYRTWISKRIGALSATSLAIQAPGSYFFAYTVATRPETDLTTWGSFFISGTFQLILVIICVYLKRAGYEDDQIFVDETVETEVDETTPIIRREIV